MIDFGTFGVGVGAVAVGLEFSIRNALYCSSSVDTNGYNTVTEASGRFRIP
jgi:hypothetical protein